MLFTTLTFLIFFTLFYIVYWSVRGRARLYLILAGSLVFYAAWSILFTFHFVFIVAINYYFVRKLHEYDTPGRKKRLLISALCINFSNLFLFKYFYLFLKIIYDITGGDFFQSTYFNSWLEAHTGYNQIILPLAISFYTFQISAYVVDEYRGLIPESTDAVRFFVFILFFPQLVAGPIMRHDDFMPQLHNISAEEKHVQRGIFFVLIGLIKKVLIADNIASEINLVYLDPTSFDGASSMIAAIGYSIRVYCDFSGYTDMARGLGFLLGFNIPENFYAPYISKNLRDLWQRWHVTLATWLRDYLYIPLGGSRTGYARVQLNTVITFTLGGLWHGAAYTFVAWGFFHGIMLVIERVVEDTWRKLRPRANYEKVDSRPANPAWQYPIRILQYLYTFALFVIGAIFFNAPDMSRAWEMLIRIFSWESGPASPYNGLMLSLLVPTLLFNLFQYFRRWPIPEGKWRYAALGVFGMITLILLGRFAPGGQEYIYFQF